MSKKNNPRKVRARRIAHEKQRFLIDELLSEINSASKRLFDRHTVVEIRRLTSEIADILDGKSFR